MYKIFMYLLLICAVSLNASEIKWAEDYNAGLQEANKVNKPVLFVSSRHTCRYCIQLNETTFKDKRVIKELNRDFVSVISYSDEDDYLPKELWQPGTPAIWFLLPSGEPMYQPLMGAMGADSFLKALSIVRKDFNEGQKK
ncbi:MAG: thioredoxin family protein [Sulfurimonas sp.]|nr:thioredoxin family protein [Sulfurimonas sp.]